MAKSNDSRGGGRGGYLISSLTLARWEKSSTLRPLLVNKAGVISAFIVEVAMRSEKRRRKEFRYG